MGLVDLHASHQLTDLSPFLVRGANSDITMVELNTDGIDFQGIKLPVLSRAKMLERDWDLENSASRSPHSHYRCFRGPSPAARRRGGRQEGARGGGRDRGQQEGKN